MQQNPQPGGSASGDGKHVLDYGNSLLYALRTGAEWGHCYENIYPVFFAFPQVFYPHGQFIEGWIVFEDQSKVILMEHGWLLSGKRIIDPTVVLATDPDQVIHYYPGVLRSWEETDALENELFPYVRMSSYGEDGMGHPGYKAAYEAAVQQARARVSASGKELLEVRASDISEQHETGVMLEPEAGKGSGVVMLVLKPHDQGGGVVNAIPLAHAIQPDSREMQGNKKASPLNKEQQRSVERIRAAARRIGELVPLELRGRSQRRKKELETLYASLALHAHKLQLQVPTLSTHYSPQQYLDHTRAIVGQLPPA